MRGGEEFPAHRSTFCGEGWVGGGVGRTQACRESLKNGACGTKAHQEVERRGAEAAGGASCRERSIEIDCPFEGARNVAQIPQVSGLSPGRFGPGFAWRAAGSTSGVSPAKVPLPRPFRQYLWGLLLKTVVPEIRPSPPPPTPPTHEHGGFFRVSFWSSTRSPSSALLPLFWGGFPY